MDQSFLRLLQSIEEMNSVIGPSVLTYFTESNMEVGTAVAQWLRCCATNRNVTGSIPDGVIGDFHCHNNPSDRTMALGSTQPLSEMVPG